MSNDNDVVEILLVEDNATDAELTIRTLKQNNLANNLVWVKDGAEALDFLFARGEYASRDDCAPPRVVLLDLRLPKVDGMEVLRAIKGDDRTRTIRTPPGPRGAGSTRNALASSGSRSSR